MNFANILFRAIFQRYFSSPIVWVTESYCLSDWMIFHCNMRKFEWNCTAFCDSLSEISWHSAIVWAKFHGNEQYFEGIFVCVEWHFDKQFPSQAKSILPFKRMIWVYYNCRHNFFDKNRSKAKNAKFRQHFVNGLPTLPETKIFPCKNIKFTC